MKIVVLIGLPGSGKSFYSEWLKKTQSFFHLSSGDICRLNPNFVDPVSQKIVAEIIESGELVSPGLIGSLIDQKLQELPKETKVVLDGFPRNLAQNQQWIKMVTKNKWEVLFFVLKCSISLAKKRIADRLICPYCQRVYNLQLQPPLRNGRCDSDDHSLVVRSDSIKFEQRLATFVNQTQPMIEVVAQSKKFVCCFFDVSKNKSFAVKKAMLDTFQKYAFN